MVFDMRGKLAPVAVLTSVLAACSTATTPATTPPSIPTTSITVTTTMPPATTTTTTVAPSTTLDRLAEIEAIFQDLEERRLQALYEGDREAFRALFANAEYMERSMVLFELVEFAAGWIRPSMFVVDVLADTDRCLAARIKSDYSKTLVGGAVGNHTEVVERQSDGWGISYSGEGWTCDGPHPFSP